MTCSFSKPTSHLTPWILVLFLFPKELRIRKLKIFTKSRKIRGGNLSTGNVDATNSSVQHAFMTLSARIPRQEMHRKRKPISGKGRYQNSPALCRRMNRRWGRYVCILAVSVPIIGFSLRKVVPEPGLERELRARQVEKEALVVWPVVLQLFGPGSLCRIINYHGPQRPLVMWVIAMLLY